MSTSRSTETVKALREAAIALLDRASHDTEAGGDLVEIKRRVTDANTFSPVPSTSRHAASTWLGPACQWAHDTTAPLAHALHAASKDLMWYCPYDESRAAPSHRDFLAGYACTLLVGPPRPSGVVAPFPASDIMVAFALQAPNQHYPAHAHRAREIYCTVAGTGQWWRGGEPWATRAPGQWLVHAPHQPHAMRSGEQPLLAMAVWLDGFDGVATFADDDAPLACAMS